MRNIRPAHIFTLTLVFLLISPYIYIGKAEEYDAEENLYVVGEIPEVSIGNDTVINLIFEDYSGLNYTKWVKISWALVHLVWPITFGYILGGGKKGLEEFKKYVCLHSIEFQAYIDGNISGWHAIVEPSLITGSTFGRKAKLTLKVRIDGPTVYPMANVIIKVIRKGAGGEVLGISYHRISLKAEHIYMLDIKPLKSAVEALPGSSVSIPVEITNLGNYVENCIISVEGKEASTLSSGQIITINPGETIRTYVQVYTPFTIFDLGTPRKIEIKAYPSGAPDKVFTAGASVVTRGVSPMFIPVLILIAILVVLIVKVFLQLGGGFTWTKKGEMEEEIKRKFFSVGTEKKEAVRESVKMKREIETVSSKPRSLRRKDLEKLIAKIKKEEMKQKRKFEKNL